MTKLYHLSPIVLALVLSCSVLWAAPPAKPAPVVEVQAVVRQNIQQSFSALATLKAQEAVTLKAEVAGRVISIHFAEGQTVSKGQLLVKLDDDLLQAELATYQASLNLANAEYQRYQALFEQQQISALDYERKKAELAQIKANMALVQAKIRQRQIRAPFTGTIGLRHFSVGDVLQANQSLVNLNSMSSLKAEIKIPETSSHLVSLKQAVNFKVDAMPDLILKGQITAIEPSLDSNTRAVVLRAIIAQSDTRVRDGMTARASLNLSQKNSVVIPEQALVAQGGKFIVFIVRDGVATATPVQLGARQVGQVVIEQGLKEGDVIVVSGQNKLSKAQMPIKAVPAQGK